MDRQRKAEGEFFNRQRGAAEKELADTISFWEQRYPKKKEDVAKKEETMKKKQAEEKKPAWKKIVFDSDDWQE